MNLSFKLPSQFDWVDLSNDEFNAALEATIKTNDNLFIQSRAGCGKSLIIKIACQMLKNTAVVAPTGSAAVQLQADGIPSGTLHSFFQLPPTTIIDQEAIFKQMFKKQRDLIKKLDVIIIDEVSMISSHMFDTIMMKLSHIRNGNLPRFILFGDVFQLPPVVNDRDDTVYDFYQKNYNGNIMFFNANLYEDMGFKVIQMNHSFRQSDPVFADNILKIGLGTATQETLDYFNQKVISWSYGKNISLSLEDALFSPASINMTFGWLQSKLSKYTSVIAKINLANKYGRLNYSTYAYPSPKLSEEEEELIYFVIGQKCKTIVAIE